MKNKCIDVQKCTLTQILIDFQKLQRNTLKFNILVQIENISG